MHANHTRGRLPRTSPTLPEVPEADDDEGGMSHKILYKLSVFSLPIVLGGPCQNKSIEGDIKFIRARREK